MVQPTSQDPTWLQDLEYQNPDSLNTVGNAANKNVWAYDIKKYYGRDSIVIHPPVDISRFKKVASKNRSGFITVGRLVPYKRVDIVVQACTKLNLKLTVVGNGPEYKRLVKIAGPTITFVTNASDDQVANYLAGAQAFLFAAEEDFGVTPVEALAASTPVIAYKAGGALDYVAPGVNGCFFENQTVESLVKAIEGFSPSDFENKKVIETSQAFSPDNFRLQIKKVVETLSQTKLRFKL